MKKVVVIGGSGFLGGHVADALLEAGYKVYIYDCCPYEQIKPGQKMVTGDLLDYDLLLETVSGSDAVYNFAGIADIGEAQERPIDTVRLNVLGNTYALEAAKTAGVKQFIFASSVYVFSQSGSFYRASKHASEHLVEAYHEKYGLTYTILRYGTLYGRRADARNSIYRYLKQALVDKKIIYHGDRHATREYIHVSDAAKLSVEALSPEFYNRNLILTGVEKMRVEDLFHMISEMLPGAIDIQFSDQKQPGHYVMTPYSFNPKLGHKLVANDHVDLGQGLLDCMSEIYEQYEYECKLQNANG